MRWMGLSLVLCTGVGMGVVGMGTAVARVPDPTCAAALTLRDEQLLRQGRAVVEQPLAGAGLDVAMTTYSVAPGDPSGDVVRTARLRDGRVVVFFGDVEGHGSGAAPLAIRLHDLLGRIGIERLLIGTSTASDALKFIDRKVESPERLVTLSVLLFDPRDGSIQFASAAVPPVRLVSEAGTVTILRASGGYVGEPGIRYRDHNSGTTFGRLEPGGVVVLTSDGARDAETADDRRVGDDLDAHLSRLVASGATARQIADAIAALACTPIDDATILVFRWRGPTDRN